ncbi:MAG: hypothetical protein AAF481_11260 [Acidobacteriota bacterium]
MPSKMVTDRQKSALAVEAAATTHSADVSAALTPIFALSVEGDEAVPDLGVLQRILGRRIQRMRLEMVSADEAHLDELADDDSPRRRRDEAADRLSVTLRSFRDLAEGIFGEGRGMPFLGLDTQVSRDPVVVLRQGRRAVERLRDESLPTPEFLLPSLSVDREDWATTLERDLQPLDEALERVAQEGREAEATLLAKQAAMDAYDRTFLQSARLLEALYRAAGLTELGDRVRPSTRRPGQTVADPEPLETPETAPVEPANAATGG